MDREPLRVTQVGLGPIGRECVRVLARRSDVALVGGVDVDPELAGRDLGEVCGLDRELGVPVAAHLGEALEATRPVAALHTTSSFLKRVEDQVLTLVDHGVSVVSSCEELLFPFGRPVAEEREIAARIDARAREAGVTVVGTGVNPGFVMDLLPVVLSAVAVEVESAVLVRVVDATRRRLPLRRKIGAGIGVEEFAERRAAGGFGHIGLEDSARAVAAAFGWPVERLEESLEPVVAPRRVETEGLVVEAGRVAGIHQVVTVASGGRPRLTLTLEMAVGAADPRDEIVFASDPPLHLRLEGGVFGDTATVGALVNVLPRLASAPPGLQTVFDLPAAPSERLRPGRV